MPPSFHPKRYPELQALLAEAPNAPERRSRADEAHDHLLLRIIRRELPGGTELKSTRLAHDLHMSRTPVVQALARLTAAGIVHQSLNLRAVVRPGAENWLIDVHRTRQLIEPEATRASAGRIPGPLLEDLLLLAEDARPGRFQDWQIAARWLDQGLHLVIADCCGNLSLREIIRRCWSYKGLSYAAGRDSEREDAEGLCQHAAILHALAGGNGDLAAGLMCQHLETAARSVGPDRIV